MRDHLPAGDGFDLPDAWAWCPEHECYFEPCSGCPDCDEDNEGTWEPDDVVGLGPPDLDHPPDWYRALAPHHDWRD
jgi:hypothetical protein